MATEVKITNYWISSSALYIQLNAMGEPNYIQCSVASGASILCYMQDIKGLGYDAGHNYQRWPLVAYPSLFPDSKAKSALTSTVSRSHPLTSRLETRIFTMCICKEKSLRF